MEPLPNDPPINPLSDPLNIPPPEIYHWRPSEPVVLAPECPPQPTIDDLKHQTQQQDATIDALNAQIASLVKTSEDRFNLIAELLKTVLPTA